MIKNYGNKEVDSSSVPPLYMHGAPSGNPNLLRYVSIVHGVMNRGPFSSYLQPVRMAPFCKTDPYLQKGVEGLGEV